MRSLGENRSIIKALESWATTDNPFNSTDELLEWIDVKNRESAVSIRKIPYEWDGFWHYDPTALGIVNDEGTFFQIKGIRRVGPAGEVEEQPIIVQDEIGYLGIIAKVIDGTMYFLMQAKVEPGNLNKYQISPTIQATRSNFTRAHGGREPAYLEYFLHKERHEVIADQIQSEQSSRFLGKRNRNIVIVVRDDVEVLESHRWMTLGQIGELMRFDNLVNMDTRTVLACLPFATGDYSYRELLHISDLYSDEALFRSLFLRRPGSEISGVYRYVNDLKMSTVGGITSLVDLCDLRGWDFFDGEFRSENGEFKVVYCDIEVEGREVMRWQQPLVEACGESTFGLILRTGTDGATEFLVRAKSEIGCFDRVELSPSVQRGPGGHTSSCTEVDEEFLHCVRDGDSVCFSGLFSEEGGRFFRESNRNTVIRVCSDVLRKPPEGYFWLSHNTLNTMVQFNNCLNIQLRNLLSLVSPRGFEG